MHSDTESWRQTERRRIALRQRQLCRFVSPEEYRELLVSRHPLERQDDVVAETRGLFDRDTNELFLVAEEELG